jgi:hypothetical protein
VKDLKNLNFAKNNHFNGDFWPIGSMVLVYLPTKLGDFVRANVGKYSIHGAYGWELHIV